MVQVWAKRFNYYNKLINIFITLLTLQPHCCWLHAAVPLLASSACPVRQHYVGPLGCPVWARWKRRKPRWPHKHGKSEVFSVPITLTRPVTECAVL